MEGSFRVGMLLLTGTQKTHHLEVVTKPASFCGARPSTARHFKTNQSAGLASFHFRSGVLRYDSHQVRLMKIEIDSHWDSLSSID
jgi:hypothetical protein